MQIDVYNHCEKLWLFCGLHIFFVKTLKTWLLVFDPIGEELRSSQSTQITSKKLNRLKYQQLFLDSLRGRHRRENRIIWNAQLTPQKPNSCPQDWRDGGQIQNPGYRCKGIMEKTVRGQKSQNWNCHSAGGPRDKAELETPRWSLRGLGGDGDCMNFTVSRAEEKPGRK